MPLFTNATTLKVIDAVAIVLSEAYQLARCRISSSGSPVLRMMTQRDQSHLELDLLRRELEILRGQRAGLCPHKRPDYTREQRLAILQLMRLRSWDAKVAAQRLAMLDRVLGQQADDQNKRLSTPLFWEHSIAGGLIASELTRHLDGKEPEIDAAFTMGLLHDVGRLVYADMFSETYTRVFEPAESLEAPVEQVESSLLLINHADAMDRVLHAWSFPKDLINPISLHHLPVGDIRRMAPHSLPQVATLALANGLAHVLLLGTPAVWDDPESSQASSSGCRTSRTPTVCCDARPVRNASLEPQNPCLCTPWLCPPWG